MKNLQWIKPGIWGGIVGAAAVLILGFAVFGWVRGSTAEKMAADHANVAVVGALTPYCVAKATTDPAADTMRAELAALTSNSQRQDYVMKAGWATLPEGITDPNKALATACAAALAALAAAG